MNFSFSSSVVLEKKEEMNERWSQRKAGKFFFYHILQLCFALLGYYVMCFKAEPCDASNDRTTIYNITVEIFEGLFKFHAGTCISPACTY